MMSKTFERLNQRVDQWNITSRYGTWRYTHKCYTLCFGRYLWKLECWD
jgi:hypothetical protein